MNQNSQQNEILSGNLKEKEAEIHKLQETLQKRDQEQNKLTKSVQKQFVLFVDDLNSAFVQLEQQKIADLKRKIDAVTGKVAGIVKENEFLKGSVSGMKRILEEIGE